MKRFYLLAALAAASLALNASDGVWKDALLRIRGAVDRNGDGLWTPTDYANPDAVELPDPMRRVGTAQKISYNMTRHADSDVRIVEREVKLGAEGRTVTRPVLYFPQPHFVDGGELVLALATPRACEMSIHFWDDPNRDSLHADACYHFGKRTVAPGGAYAVEGRPFVAGAAVTGGLAAWTKVFAEIRKW